MTSDANPGAASSGAAGVSHVSSLWASKYMLESMVLHLDSSTTDCMCHGSCGSGCRQVGFMGATVGCEVLGDS